MVLGDSDAAGVVGREAELALVSGLFTGGAGPDGVVLEGEAGIGKTTLWKQGVAAARRAGWEVLACRPVTAEADLSFGALGDLVTPVLDEVLPVLSPPQRWALEVVLLLREPEGPPPDQRAIGLSLLSVLRVLARTAPVLVAIDDAQWVDPVSAAALEFALRRLEEDDRVKMLVTVRLEERRKAPLRLDHVLEEERLRRVRVGPLSLGAMHRVLTSRLGVALPRPALLRVHEASGGNPFFALEIARALVGRGRQIEVGRHLEVSDDLDEVLGARLAGLPDAVRDLLAGAAAMSNPTVSALAAVAGRDSATIAGDLDAAASVGIVDLHGDEVRFTHPLLASTVYWHTSEAGRRRLHRQLASVTADVEERARHLALAAVEPDEEVAKALDAAAGHATSRGAAVAAAELAELATRLTPPTHAVELRCRRMRAAARHIATGDPAKARRMLEGLVDEAPPGTERVDALVLLAGTRQDDIEARGGLLERALPDAAGDPARLARVRRGLAEVAAIRGDQPAALAHARAAIGAAEASDDTGMLVSTMAYVGLFETFVGEVTPGLLEHAVELEPTVRYLSEYDSPSMVFGYRLLYEDRLDEARRWLKVAEARAAEHNDFTSQVSIQLHLAELEVLAGNWTRSAQHSTDGLELAEQLDADHSRSGLLYIAARADAQLGRVDAARKAATKGVELARASNSEIYEFNNQRVLGFLQLSLGDHAGAVACLEPLLRLGSLVSSRSARCALLPDLVEALVGAGDVARARALVEVLEQTASEFMRPTVVAVASRCRGLVRAEEGDVDAALVAFDQALRMHDQVAIPFERARTLLALGQTQRRARRRRDARRSLDEALAVFEELGAALWADRARHELGRIGGRAPTVGGLTPTEERVAALVAEGCTNRQAATTLYVSEHTVEGHLSRIYVKLGVHSRAELAHRLAVAGGEHTGSPDRSLGAKSVDSQLPG